MKLIQDYYNYVLFTDNAVEKYLSDWLLDRSWYTTETDNMLFDMLLKKCLDEKIILPGFLLAEIFNRTRSVYRCIPRFKNGRMN